MLSNRSSTKKGLYIGISIAVLVWACITIAVLVWAFIKFGTRNSLSSALSPVCQGEGVPEAKGFDPDSKIHPTIVLDRSGGYWGSSEGLGGGWTPSSVSETELVVCIAEEVRRNYAACGYSYTNLLTRSAFIYDAKTGDHSTNMTMILPIWISCADGGFTGGYHLSEIKRRLIIHMPSIESELRVIGEGESD